MAAAKLVFGGAAITSDYGTPEQHRKTLRILKDNRVEAIDTGQMYGDSEESLGRAQASANFVLGTKHPGGLSPDPSVSKKDGVLELAKQSLTKLQTNQVCDRLLPTNHSTFLVQRLSIW